MEMAVHDLLKFGRRQADQGSYLFLRPLPRLNNLSELRDKLRLGTHCFGVRKFKIGINIATAVTDLDSPASYS